MQAFEIAAKAHEQFEEARSQALDALMAERNKIDAKIAEVKSWGQAKKTEGKKRGRPSKDKPLTNGAGVLR